MDADEDVEVDQFSPESGARLRAAAEELGAVLERHTARLLALRGSADEVPELFDLHDGLRRATAAWDDAVFDHTGTFPLALDLGEDEEPDEEEADDEPDDQPDADVAAEVAVSVVSRWDLVVTDVEEVVAAAREAHRRSHPDDTEEDARLRVDDDGVGPALYALAHDVGEPWFEVRGLELEGAHRVYVARDLEVDDVRLEPAPLVVPDGDVLYRETW